MLKFRSIKIKDLFRCFPNLHRPRKKITSNKVDRI